MNYAELMAIYVDVCIIAVDWTVKVNNHQLTMNIALCFHITTHYL